jgi:hypothetical protein
MPKIADPRPTIPVPFLRGQYSSGDASQIPDGYCRRMRNLLVRPGPRMPVRAPFTFDNVVGVSGLMNFEDGANKVTRLFFFNDSNDFYLKAVSGELNSVSFNSSSFNALRILNAVNYHGQIYITLNSLAGNNTDSFASNSTSLPIPNLAFGPVNNGIRPSALESYIDRLFAFGATLNFTNQLSTSYAYDPAVWSRSTTNVDTITSGSTVTYRILPTVTTNSALQTTNLTISITGPTDITYLAQLAGDHETYRVPMTQQIYINYVWATATAYSLGAIRTPTAPNGFRYRVTTAGTSAAGEPVWGTTPGGTTADGSVVWTLEGSDILAQQDITVPSVSDTPDFQSFYVTGSLKTPSSTRIAARLKFGNSSTATLATLAAVRFAYKDGLTDGAADKRNYGHQIVLSSFKHPFMNTESGTVGTENISDQVVWSEPGEAANVIASNFYRCTDIAGRGTALKSVGNRLLAAKRNAVWIFNATSDAANPILPEDVLVGVGCLGPRAHDEFEGWWYFIGENEVYRMKPGVPPEPLCGDGMREEILNKDSATWVESQATYNLPILRVHKKDRQVWVYTQKGRIYVYHLDYQAWSFLDAGGGSSLTPTGYEVRDMLYNPNTQTMYVAWGTAAAGTAGLTRAQMSFPAWAVARAYTTNYTVVPTTANGFRYRATTGGTSHATTEPTWPTAAGSTVVDNTVTWTCEDTDDGAYDTISNSGTLPVVADLWLKPLEMTAPRWDAILEEIGVHHSSTVAQASASQTTTAYVSFNEGVTFPKSHQMTLNTSPGGKIRDPMVVWQMGPSVLPRIEHSGYGGEGNFSLSVLDATIQIKRGEYPAANPTAGTNNL